MSLKIGEVIHPGVEEEIALEQAKGTISNIADAIIELCTNCDDSYLTLENIGEEVSGKIDIYIEREKGRRLKELRIEDNAGGMSPEKVRKILCYGKRTSGIFEGINVRGLFGRGLKESIIALGYGEITSVSNGIKTQGLYYWDDNVKLLTWKTTRIEKTKDNSGTIITIKPRDGENVDCPNFDVIKNKIENHFSLRDMLVRGGRNVNLIYKQVGTKKQTPPMRKRLKYISQAGQQIENKKLYLKGFGVVFLKLFESNERLDFSRNDPGSRAGLIVKTTNAALDLQLFGFDRDPDAQFFYGEIIARGIAERVKEYVRGLIKTDRTGLNWKHPFCQELEKEAQKVLMHHIERRRRQHDQNQKRVEMPEERVAKIKRLVRKLNKLGKEILGEEGVGPDTLSQVPSNISQITIFPSEANSPPDEYRTYTIYNLADSPVKTFDVKINLDDPRGKFEIVTSRIKLQRHKKASNLLMGSFRIKGFRLNDKTAIIARQGTEEDLAEFTVGEKGKKKQKGKNPPKERGGGLFKDLIFDSVENDPIQRVYFNRNNGEIRIYINYPGIAPYLGINGEGSESQQGSILLSELIAEAFCKETARRKVERESFNPAGNLDKYLQLYNMHMKMCIPIVQSIWVK
jgi:hypothetical protein